MISVASNHRRGFPLISIPIRTPFFLGGDNNNPIPDDGVRVERKEAGEAHPFWSGWEREIWSEHLYYVIASLDLSLRKN